MFQKSQKPGSLSLQGDLKMDNQQKMPGLDPLKMLEEQKQAIEKGSQPLQMLLKEEEEKTTQKKEEEKELQAKKENNEVVSQATKSGTKAKLPDEVQTKMEGAFGTSFDDVNIHKDDNSATDMGALAYTQGKDVHFAPGQYNPGTQKGQELIGHELTHVEQQKAGRVQPTKQGKGMAVNDNPALEKEADVMGKKAAEGKGVDAVQEGKGIQKKEDKKNENVSVKAVGGTAPIKSNEVNWKYSPELVKRFYPNYEGEDIHMFTYTYPIDGKKYIIMRQDWSSGDNISDYRYYATTNGSNWVRFNPTSRIEGLSEDLSKAACFMLATAGATVGFAALVEAGAIGGVGSLKNSILGVVKDFVNQLIVENGDIKEVDFANVITSGIVKEPHIKNLIVSSVDLTISQGGDINKVEDILVEFLIREGTDAIINKSESILKKNLAPGEFPSKGTYGYDFSKDLIKKLFRKNVKEVIKQHLDVSSDISPEN